MAKQDEGESEGEDEGDGDVRGDDDGGEVSQGRTDAVTHSVSWPHLPPSPFNAV
jgi:hypothetical protein